MRILFLAARKLHENISSENWIGIHQRSSKTRQKHSQSLLPLMQDNCENMPFISLRALLHSFISMTVDTVEWYYCKGFTFNALKGLHSYLSGLLFINVICASIYKGTNGSSEIHGMFYSNLFPLTSDLLAPSHSFQFGNDSAFFFQVLLTTTEYQEVRKFANIPWHPSYRILISAIQNSYVAFFNSYEGLNDNR